MRFINKNGSLVDARKPILKVNPNTKLVTGIKKHGKLLNCLRKYREKEELRMQNTLVEEPNVKLTCLSDSRRIVQKAMKEKGLSSAQVRKQFKEIRYDK